VTLRFDRGTLVLEGTVDALADRLEAAGMTFDLRIARWRAPAACYRDLFAALHRAQEQGLLQLDDRARTYGPLALRFAAERTPRFYQSEAIDAWNRAGRRGLVVLPTGAPRGRWKATLEMDGVKAPAGELAFSVEDFAPRLGEHCDLHDESVPVVHFLRNM
jgi:hypothetical protein